MEDAVLGPNGWECDPTRGPYKVYADVDPVTGGIAGLNWGGEYTVYQKPPFHRVIREFHTLQDVTNSATGGTVTPSIDSASPMGGRALKLAFGVGVTQHDLTISGFNLVDFKNGRGKIVVLAQFEDARAISQIQCFCGTTTGFGTSIRVDYGMANDAIHHSHSFVAITIEPNLAAVDNLAATDEVTAIRLRFQRSGTPISNGIQDLPGAVAASAYATNVWIKGVYLPESTLPFVMLTFDDDSASWIDLLQPVLASRRLRGTFGVMKSRIGSNDTLYLTESELLQMHSYGHDLCSHNDTNTAFSIATMAAYLAEFRLCRDWLYNLGITRRLDYHPYVQGKFNPELSAALANEGIKYARTVNSRNFERSFQNSGCLQMTSRSLGSGTNQAAAQLWVTQAETRQQDVIVMGHTFAATSADSVTWAISEMETFLDFCLAEKASGRIGGIGSLSDYLKYTGVEM